MANVYDVNGNNGTGVTNFDANVIPTNLNQNVSPDSPQLHKTNVTFSCNYTTGEGTLVTDAQVYVNINDIDFETEETDSYLYPTADLAVGNHSWYCKASKYGYEPENGSESSYTINPIPTNLYQSASPSSPQSRYSNITFSCNYEDVNETFIQNASVYVNIDGTNYSASVGTFYEYSTNALSAGDHSWNCIASKYGYESKNGSNENYTMQAIAHNYGFLYDDLNDTRQDAEIARQNQSSVGYYAYGVNNSGILYAYDQLKHDSIFYFSGHGWSSGGGLVFYNGNETQIFWANNATVSFSNYSSDEIDDVLLAVFNACETAADSPQAGNVTYEAQAKGVNCIIGFKGLIDWVGSSYWSERFWHYISSDNDTIQNAAYQAKQDTCDSIGCRGIDTIVIVGDCDVTISPQRYG